MHLTSQAAQPTRPARPVAFANGNGTWTITNGPAPQFITDWAHQPGVRLAPGSYR